MDLPVVQLFQQCRDQLWLLDWHQTVKLVTHDPWKIYACGEWCLLWAAKYKIHNNTIKIHIPCLDKWSEAEFGYYKYQSVFLFCFVFYFWNRTEMLHFHKSSSTQCKNQRSACVSPSHPPLSLSEYIERCQQ